MIRVDSSNDNIHNPSSPLTSKDNETSSPADSSRRKRRHPQAASALMRLKRFHSAGDDENDEYDEKEDEFQSPAKTIEHVEVDDALPYSANNSTDVGRSLILSMLPSFLVNRNGASAPFGSTSSRESSPFSHSATSPSSSSANTSGLTSTSSAGAGAPLDQYTASAGLCNLLALTQKIEANILSERPKAKVTVDVSRKTLETSLNFSIDNILNTNSSTIQRALDKAYGNASCSFSSILSEIPPQPLYTNISTSNTEASGCDITSPRLLPSEAESVINRFPAWIFCTRYSDRPSSGSRSRKLKQKRRATTPTNASQSSAENQNVAYVGAASSITGDEEKRPRTAFTAEQLARLKQQFADSRYLTEKRRQELAHELGLNESQIKIWFQNKRAKLKKSGHVGIVNGGASLTSKVDPLDTVLPPLASGAAFAAIQLMNTRHGVFADASIPI